MSGDRAKPSYTTLRYEVADAIATITLDRPDALNALTIPMKTELLAAFGAVARDRAVRAVVLTGAGRAFCAGQDLKERLEPDAAPLAVEVRERYNPIIRGDAGARPADRRGDQRRGRRRRAPRSRSPATSGSRPRVRASSSRSGGSGSCRTAARRGSCHGSSGRRRPPSWRCSARSLSARRMRSGSGWSRGSCRRETACRDGPGGGGSTGRPRAAGPRPDEARPRAQLVGRSRDGPGGRGIPPGSGRSDGGPRRGSRRRSSRSGRRGSPGSSPRPTRTLTSRGAGSYAGA